MSASKDWIQTFSGLKFFPLAPQPESINIVDIAHALSNVCRYTGHVKRFYSVGEHSVRVSKRCYDLTSDPVISLWGLLHDASEAYICDIARPVKHQPELAPYREAEHRLQMAIIRRFGLPEFEPEEVLKADLELLYTEAESLMSPMHPDWKASAPGVWAPLTLRFGDVLGWPPDLAERRFLRRFELLADVIAESSDLKRAVLGSPA